MSVFDLLLAYRKTEKADDLQHILLELSYFWNNCMYFTNGFILLAFCYEYVTETFISQNILVLGTAWIDCFDSFSLCPTSNKQRKLWRGMQSKVKNRFRI